MIEIHLDYLYKIVDITQNDQLAAAYEMDGCERCAIDDQLIADWLGWA